MINDAPAYYICKTCKPQVSEDDSDSFRAMSDSGNVFVCQDSPGPTSVSETASMGFPNLPSLERIISVATQAATKAAIEATVGIFEEMLEKRDKKRNLVIVGVPEIANASKKDQVQADLKKVQEYCGKLNIDEGAIQKTFREGKKKGFRIMKVCFEQGCSAERMDFLKKAKKVCMERDEEFQNLKFKPFVRMDMTFRERQADAKLREELKRRRDDGENVIIRGGKIIPRPEN